MAYGQQTPSWDPLTVINNIIYRNSLDNLID